MKNSQNLYETFRLVKTLLVVALASFFAFSCQHIKKEKKIEKDFDYPIAFFKDNNIEEGYFTNENYPLGPIVSDYSPCKETLSCYQRDVINNDSVEEYFYNKERGAKFHFLRNIILYSPNEAFYYIHPDDFYQVYLKSDDDRVKIYQIEEFWDRHSSPMLPNSFCQFLYTTKDEKYISYAFSNELTSGRLFTYFTDVLEVIFNDGNGCRKAEELLTFKDKYGKNFYIVTFNEIYRTEITTMRKTAVAFTIEEDGPHELPIFHAGEKTYSKLSFNYNVDDEGSMKQISYDKKNQTLYVPLVREEDDYIPSEKNLLYKFDGYCFKYVGIK